MINMASQVSGEPETLFPDVLSGLGISLVNSLLSPMELLIYCVYLRYKLVKHKIRCKVLFKCLNCLKNVLILIKSVEDQLSIFWFF
jgi:hypothetical protein